MQRPEKYATARNNMQRQEQLEQPGTICNGQKKMCNSKKQAMARNNVQRSETGKEQYATVNNTKKR